MIHLTTHYSELCQDYIQGNTRETIKNNLDNLSMEIFRHLNPEAIVRIQLDALMKVVGVDDSEKKYFQRCFELAQMTTKHFDSTQNNLKELVQQAEEISGAGTGLLGLKQYLEDTGFMLSRLAEMTEYLDHKIAQMSPFEMQLRKLEQISHAIVQNANFGVLVVDSCFRITMINKASSEILAIPEEVIGSTLAEVFSGHTKETTAVVLNALSGDRHQMAEVEITGKRKVLDIVADKLVGKDGEKEGAVALIYDISEKEAEQKAIEENIKLAAVGKLAAGVAHEIRNPLTVIKGFSQLLMNKNDYDTETRHYIQIICAEAERANAFIQDFLNLGKPKNPRKRIIDAREIVSETVALIESQCFINGIEIDKQIEASGEIMADPDQIKQVLINLAKNSVEAMEGCPKAKQLSFGIQKCPENRFLRIFVRDTGCGIPPEILEKITTPFFTTKRFGTGLGLNISQSIIERHGGKLKFSSDDQYTTATIELPLNCH